jgi:DNA recombination protein RmuC
MTIALVVTAIVALLALVSAVGLFAQREAARRDVAVLAERLQGAEERLALATGSQAMLRDSFQSLAAEALRTNNQAFLDIARGVLDDRRDAVDQLVAPIRDTLATIESQRRAQFTSLGDRILALASTSDSLREQTARLHQALHSPVVRGRWGEMTLRRVVELAGMAEHCDFSEQKSTSATDLRLRPDLTVHLPGGATVAVDAKTPLAAYLEAHEATDAATRTARLRDHARQVRAHVSRLADKAYWNQLRQSPEFVVAFLPGESFLSAAVDADPALLEDSASRRVILATPTTLIPLLLAVAHGWREQQVAHNAARIADLGRELYERLTVFATHLVDMQRHLSRAVDSFNHTVASLDTRVLVSARRLHDYGVAAPVPLPAMEPVTLAPREPAVTEAPAGPAKS